MVSTTYNSTLNTTGTDGQSNANCIFFGQSGINLDEWFVWTATATGNASATTCGIGPDTKIAVYSGAACPPGAAIACNDDACGLLTTVLFPVTAGQPYLIQIGVFPGAAGGSGNLTVADQNSGPTNDNCSDAEPVTELCWYEYDNRNATIDGAVEGLCASQIGHDIWYIWSGECIGSVVFETCGGSSRDTQIAVYNNGANPVPVCPTGSAIACNDDSCGLQSRILFSAIAGNYYVLRVGNFGASAGGPGAFRLSCGGCDTIGCQPGTEEEAEPCGMDTNGGCNSINPDSYDAVLCDSRVHGTAWAIGGMRDTDWFRLVAPASGVISVTLTSDFEASLFVLDIGSPVPHPCGTITTLGSATSIPCASTTLTTSGLVPGNVYVVFVAPTVFEGLACRTDYILQFEIGSPCEPCCCPDGTALTPTTYVFEIGGISPAADASFPWTISFPDAPGCVTLSGSVPLPGDACAALSADFIARGIASAAAANGANHIIRTRSVAGPSGCAQAYLLIDVYGNAMCPTCPMVLCVGTPGCCVPPSGSCVPAPLASPSISAVPLLCGDCDGNGTDDRVDVICGRLSDANNNGVFDQCEGFMVNSPLGFPVSPLNASLSLGTGNQIRFTAPGPVARGLHATAPGFQSFGILADVSLSGAVAGGSRLQYESRGVLDAVPDQARARVILEVQDVAAGSYRAFADFSSYNATHTRVELVNASGMVISSTTVPNDLNTPLVSFGPVLPEVEVDSFVLSGLPGMFTTERGATLRFAAQTEVFAITAAMSLANVIEVRFVAEGTAMLPLGELASASVLAQNLSGVTVTQMSAGQFDGVRIYPGTATSISNMGDDPCVTFDVSDYSNYAEAEVKMVPNTCVQATAVTVVPPVGAFLCPAWKLVLCGKRTGGDPLEEEELDPLDFVGRADANSQNTVVGGVDIFVPLCVQSSICSGAPKVEYSLDGITWCCLNPQPIGVLDPPGTSSMGSINVWPSQFTESLGNGGMPCVTVTYTPPTSGMITYDIGYNTTSAGSCTPCASTTEYANGHAWGTTSDPLFMRFESQIAPDSGFLGITAVKLKGRKISSKVSGYNMMAVSSPADINGDGVINSQDFFDYLVVFFANSPSADFNSDGTVNSQDFFDFLVCFFGTC